MNGLCNQNSLLQLTWGDFSSRPFIAIRLDFYNVNFLMHNSKFSEYMKRIPDSI